MYSNLGTKNTKKRVNEQTADNEIEKRNKFIPETKIIASHVEIISNVCPKSGWDKSKIIIGNKMTILKKYFRYRFFLSKDIIKEITITKKGFKVSIGWNLGNDPISNHLFDPLTSIPIKGTNNKLIKAKKKSITEILIKNFWFNKEKTKIKSIPIVTKSKCFKKK